MKLSHECRFKGSGIWGGVLVKHQQPHNLPFSLKGLFLAQVYQFVCGGPLAFQPQG